MCTGTITTGVYESIRSLLALIFLNEKLMERIEKERKLNEDHPEFWDRIGKGANFKRHKEINKDVSFIVENFLTYQQR